MSLRQKFEGVGCKRFGDDNEGQKSLDKFKGAPKLELRLPMEVDRALAEEQVENSKLRADNKALRQQVAELTLKLAGTKTGVTKRDDKKSTGLDDKKSASSGRGRPRLPEEVRKANRAKQVAAANKKRTKPK